MNIIPISALKNMQSNPLGATATAQQNQPLNVESTLKLIDGILERVSGIVDKSDKLQELFSSIAQRKQQQSNIPQTIVTTSPEPTPQTQPLSESIKMAKLKIDDSKITQATDNIFDLLSKLPDEYKNMTLQDLHQSKELLKGHVYKELKNICVQVCSIESA